MNRKWQQLKQEQAIFFLLKSDQNTVTSGPISPPHDAYFLQLSAQLSCQDRSWLCPKAEQPAHLPTIVELVGHQEVVGCLL